jgi:hypothetical protein
MKKKIILGIKIENRKELVGQVQHILTKYGCSVKTRIGLHDTENETDKSAGIVLLELIGDVKEIANLEAELLVIPTIELQKMYFSIDK